ncbi:fasciclin-3-like isoform X1 [Trichogramma pretiosum]|uniref:fasciclin-3-like isoform X1 n=1 Tax=Trichogramma pretiosum TaxID=7493 RepID=UPI0006C9DDD3|nr:fasciclin-3-like isoform X1 [Trichogramma pretiosum]
MYRATAKMINGLLMLAIFGFASIQAYVSNPLLIEIEPDNQVAVILGQSQTILCKAAVPIHFCRFVIPGEPTLVLRENLPSDNVINYYGTGFANGQCGIKISSIQDKHDGEVTCYLTPETGQTESSNKVRLIVAKPPSYPVLRLDRNNGVYKAGGKMEISCMAYEGRPPANVSLYLDNEQIGYDERPMILGRTVDVANPSMLNASRSVTPEDNGKTLRCVASHIALEAPIETSKQIEVYFKPQPQQPIERFGFSIGRRGEINVTVHANPKPDFIWNVGDLKIPASKYDSNNRLQTSSPFDLGRGYWSVVLTIDSVQKSDFENVYTLEAINVEGKQIYKIRLSSSSEPPAGVDMDAGSIIGIVLGVLVLTLAVFLVIFARMTGRWCFTDDSAKRNIGESDVSEPAESIILLRRFVRPTKTDDASPRRSDTESTGRYSRTEVDTTKNSSRLRPKINLSQLFKRNKDKVSGADTDTVRTVVTMEDEKAPTSETTTAAETPTSGTHEGGIVYAELDLAQQQQNTARRLTDEKTEYAEIVYSKTDGSHPTPDK